MADSKDELEARRWFRQRLAEIGAQYPELRDPEHQERLREALEEEDGPMPRTPTGRPVGRPKGSGRLGEEGQGHKRLTVRLPSALYDALEAVAEREHDTREAPELARTVRNALEHYLACPQRRQTEKAPWVGMLHNGPTEKTAVALGETKGQTGIVPEPLGDSRRQTEIPLYDTTRYYLGKLCPAQHDYHGTGQSLRRLHNQGCRECERVGKHTARRAKRQATV
jgi:hypothetical protein